MSDSIHPNTAVVSSSTSPSRDALYSSYTIYDGANLLCVEIPSDRAELIVPDSLCGYFTRDALQPGAFEGDCICAAAALWQPGLEPISAHHDTGRIAATMWKQLVAGTTLAAREAGEALAIHFHHDRTQTDEEGKYTTRLGYRVHTFTSGDNTDIVPVILKEIPMKTITVGTQLTEWWPENAFGPDEPAFNQCHYGSRQESVVDWEKFSDPETRIATNTTVEEVHDGSYA